MAKVIVGKQNLRVEIGFLEAFQSLQRSFEISLERVRGATEDSQYIQSGLGLRSPGTGLPNMIAKGNYRKKGERIFALWHRGQETVVVELKNSKWDRLVLGCDNAKALAEEINRAIQN